MPDAGNIERPGPVLDGDGDDLRAGSPGDSGGGRGSGPGDAIGSAGNSVGDGGGTGDGNGPDGSSGGTSGDDNTADGTPGTPGNGGNVNAVGTGDSAGDAGGKSSRRRNSNTGSRRGTGDNSGSAGSVPSEERVSVAPEIGGLVADPVETTFSMPGDKSPAAPARRGRKTAEAAPTSKATPDAVAVIAQALLYLYGQSRPGPARNAWVFSEDELAPITIPGAKILNRIGGKALNTFMLVADPISLLLGVHAVIEEGKRRENALFVQFIKENPSAAAEYEAWEQRRKAGRNGSRRGEEAPLQPDFPDHVANDFGAETIGADSLASDLGNDLR